MSYLVKVEYSYVEAGQPSIEYHHYEHPVANSDEAAWAEVKKRWAVGGTTVYMAKVVKKAIPATHQDSPII